MSRKIIFAEGEFYHIYNRGNNKSIIFLDEGDRKRFQKLLYICNSKEPVVFKSVQHTVLDKIKIGEPLVNIGAYCLMDNHFHLLLHEKQDKGISLFVNKISTAYSMYFNKKYDRTGSLFEGPFRATHADTDEYLKYLFAYIHLNPVKMIDSTWKENGLQDYENTKKYLKEYEYSSYLDHLGVKRGESIILNPRAFPEYFSENITFEGYVNDWLMYRECN